MTHLESLWQKVRLCTNKKNVVAGLGEIGMPIHNLLSKNSLTVGYDLNEKLMNKKIFEKYIGIPTSILHISIPFSKKFILNFSIF